MSLSQGYDYAHSSKRRNKSRSRSPRSEKRILSPHHNYRDRSSFRSSSQTGSSSSGKQKYVTSDAYKQEAKNQYHRGASNHDNGRLKNNQKVSNHEDELMELRRQERETISLLDCPNIWGKSPVPEEYA